MLIHRPHRRDWSLPKGKREPGESAVDCALREVQEETGLLCRLGPELPQTRYLDRKGRPKRVRYWAMERVRGVFVANDEVDEVRWLRVDRVGELLTNDRDHTVVAGLQKVHFSFV
jgi:8-oxo-dGTP diphosphatase